MAGSHQGLLLAHATRGSMDPIKGNAESSLHRPSGVNFNASPASNRGSHLLPAIVTCLDPLGIVKDLG